MPGLILKLTPGERFMINGVVLENGDHRARVRILTENAFVLRLRDAIHPDAVDTPVKRVCYAAQMVLACETTAEAARPQLLTGIEQLSQVFTDPDSRAKLDAATQALSEGRFYQVLKALRGLLAREARLIGFAEAQTGMAGGVAPGQDTAGRPQAPGPAHPAATQTSAARATAGRPGPANQAPAHPTQNHPTRVRPTPA